MIFGDPYRFAIWVEYLPQWGESFKNGVFNLIVNGNLYPDDIRTATLSTDLFDIIDGECSLISLPENEMIFNMPVNDAFCFLSNLKNPEPTEEDEYPVQVFDYCILSSNVSEWGGCFFAVSHKGFTRIIGGKTEILVNDMVGGVNKWEKISYPLIEDVVIQSHEIKKIMDSIKIYADSIFK